MDRGETPTACSQQAALRKDRQAKKELQEETKRETWNATISPKHLVPLWVNLNKELKYRWIKGGENRVPVANGPPYKGKGSKQKTF